MDLECLDESRACWVGPQSTPSSVIRATVEGREILSAADGSAAVEDDCDTCVITTWTASASDVCAGLASLLGPRRRSVSAARATAELLRLRARLGVQSGASVDVVSGIEPSGRNDLRPNSSSRA